MALIPSNRVVDIRPIGSDGSVLMANSSSSDGKNWSFLSTNNIIVVPIIVSYNINASSILAGTGLNNPVFTYFLLDQFNEERSSSTIIAAGSGTKTLGSSPFTWTGLFPNSIPNTTQSFTISITNQAGTSQSGITVTWMQLQYWGTSGDPGSYNQTFVSSLNSSGFNTTHTRTIAITGNADKYIWYAFRDAAGTPTFKDNSTNIKGGFSLMATGISFTNRAGLTETYQLWRSDNSGLGSLSILIDNN